MLLKIASTSPSSARAMLIGLALICVSGAPAYSQALFQCSQGQTSCSNENGSAIYGGYDAFSNTIVDTNPPNSGSSNGDNIIAGSNNTLTTTGGSNSIVGNANTVSAGGNASVTGTNNSINTGDANIYVTGSGNTVTGTHGGNEGLNITGGSNTVDASSGNITGSVNSTANMTRGNVSGSYNSVTNASDAAVLGNGNTVTADQTITVGNGNTNQAGGGVVVGNNSGLGIDAKNSVVLGNDTFTDRANTVDVGDRTISGVSVRSISGLDAKPVLHSIETKTTAT